MAEHLAAMLRVSLFLLVVGCISAKRFSIMAPNVFHIGVEEQVSISVFDANIPTTVKLYLEDYPHRRKRFSEVEGMVDQRSNIFLPVKVEPKDLPDIASLDKQYVYLVAKSDDAHFQFEQEAKVLLSYKTGMVFIQTDKPIYTPKQTVEIRIIPIEVDMRPSQRQITVIVENPQGIRVNEWRDLKTTTGIISHLKIKLAEFVLLGNWTITAFYGHGDKHNTSAQFEVKEYVLPKFSVKLTVPLYIMKTDYEIKIKILARYTYGKPVQGNVLVTLSIVSDDGQIDPFARHLIFLHNSGETPMKELVQRIRDLPGGLWFPKLNTRRLRVQADVIDRATGNKESAVDESCRFTSSPYLVKFRNTPKYFKPGFNFDVKVVVTYPNKQPARRVRVLIAANGTKQDETTIELMKFDRNDPNAWEVTDELGQADFTIHSCSNCPIISIKVKTDDENLEGLQNAFGILMVYRFDAENGNSIMVRQENSKEVGKVGSKMTCQIHRDPQAGAIKVSLAVVSRGRILSHDTIDSLDGGKIRHWSFFVSPQMSPSARLIAYYIDNREPAGVVADSILLDIEDSLLTKVYFPDAVRSQDNKIEKAPASTYNITINATQGTRVILLGVDESVYLLRNENRLTKERIFKTAEELDLGCDVGGGKNNRDIFKNAGVVLMTNNFVSDGREDYGCKEDVSRNKRSAEKTLEDKVCCDMGKNNGDNVTCVKVTMDGTKRLSKRCREIFWKCCTELYGTNDTAMLGRSVINYGDDDSPGENKNPHVRSYFPDVWIYTEGVVGPEGVFKEEMEIPHTITTWVMQAVAINNKTGLGLATPLRIVGYQDFFVSLGMPYSVKRGEQISLLVTVFNYLVEELPVNILLKGHRDFCSIAKDEQYALIGKVTVKPNDASSVAVPIIPKRIGEVEIEVHANIIIAGYNGGGDAVKRTLLVVPEGKEHRKSQSFILDPSGNLNDGPKDGEKKEVQPTKAPFQSQTYLAPDGQHDSIELKVPKEAIPDSVRVIVYVTGNLLGPVVNTTIEGGLEKFFRLPTGCGEQNMVKLAPNVYVLEYLINTDQLTGANEKNVYRFIQSGYENELNYRRDDKSFSAHNGKPGSTWLTAFVMKVFCKSQQFPGINIDDKVVCESVAWLIQNQRTDGALPEVHMVNNKGMVGGVYTEGDAVMTAFVLSSLAECKCKGVDSQAAIRRATDYLEKKYKTLDKPYSMALTAYALSLVNSNEKHKANDRLVQNAVYDSAKKSRYWNAGGNALNVETAGYALLTQVILGRISYAGPIVTYLTNQRKGGVGFVSTQDTVVALQALALYSKETAGNALDLRVKLTSEVKADWKPPETHLTPENALLRVQHDVEKYLGGKLFVDTRGTGVGQLEVEARYNLPTSRNETCHFYLSTTVKEVKDNNGELHGPVQMDVGGNENDAKRVKKQKTGNKRKGGRRNRRKGGKKIKRCRGKKTRKCRKNQNKIKKPTKPTRPPPKYQPVKSIHLKVCTRYQKKTSTGMSIMEIGVLTGFKPRGFKNDFESLKKLQETLPELDKYEVSDRSLVLYLSEIPNDRQLCVDVQFDREYYVGVVQAVPVNVYDYYEPDESCSKFYGPDKSSTLRLGVCDVDYPACKCSNEECPPYNPAIGNIGKLNRIACTKYHYVIKGKVWLVDEQESMVLYLVEVVQIIQQGNKELKVGQTIDLWKREACRILNLERKQEYLFMGQDTKEKMYLDNTSFVKLWPSDNDGNIDKRNLDNFAANYTCSS